MISFSHMSSPFEGKASILVSKVMCIYESLQNQNMNKI